MFEFELTEVAATLEEFKPKTRKGENGKVPCAEVVISCPCPDPDVLAFFSPDLKETLFDTDGPKDLAGGLPLKDSGMKFPMERKEEMGGTLLIHTGIGPPMRLEDAGFDDFKITPVNGGSVIVVFRVRCMPAELQAGNLYMLQEQAITISVEPRDLASMPEAA